LYHFVSGASSVTILPLTLNSEERISNLPKWQGSLDNVLFLLGFRDDLLSDLFLLWCTVEDGGSVLCDSDYVSEGYPYQTMPELTATPIRSLSVRSCRIVCTQVEFDELFEICDQAAVTKSRKGSSHLAVTDRSFLVGQLDRFSMSSGARAHLTVG
jgi:hypothetical protein